MPHINICSSDGVNFKVDIEVAEIADTIKEMIENLGLDENDKEIVPLPKVHSTILKMVIEWATHHRDCPIPEDYNDKISENISQWDANFLNVPQSTLFELIQAANYLNIEGLLDVACKTVANQIKGKRPAEIRVHFNIKRDYTPQEEKALLESNLLIDL